MSNKTAAARVQSGVARLQKLESCCNVPHLGSDQTVPSDWKTRVNLSDLDLGDSSLCVLGQIFGSYDDGLKALGLEMNFSTSRDMGFESGNGSYENYVSSYELTTEWKKFFRGQQSTQERRTGQLLRHDTYGTVVLKLAENVSREGQELWVAEKMNLDRDGHIMTDVDKNFVLRTGENLDQSYSTYVEQERIVAGRLYKAKDNTMFYAESVTKLWKLSATEGATWCDRAYFEREHGALVEMTTNVGEVLSKAMNR